MTPSIQEPAGQRGRPSGEMELRETRFERSPWAHVAYGERKNLQVTMWIGFKAIVIALSFPHGAPEDVQISIAETGMTIRGAAKCSFVTHSIDLPCPVETRPIRIENSKGTTYILLRKK